MQKYNHMHDWNLEQAPKSNLPPVPEAKSEECFLIIDIHLGLVLFVSVKEKKHKPNHLSSLKKRKGEKNKTTTKSLTI